MYLDILTGELERLFELDELEALSRDLLGFDPEEVGGSAEKGSFASALTWHCVEQDAVEALCDAVWATKKAVDPRILELRLYGSLAEPALKPGDQLAGFAITRPLGEGRTGRVYAARLGDQDFRIKLIATSATRDKRSLHRYLTHNRLIGRLSQPGIPHQLTVGAADGRYYVAHRLIEGPTLAARLGWAGPTDFEAARPLLSAILHALAALHDRGLAHGNLHPENIVVRATQVAGSELVLLDAGCELLRSTRSRGAGVDLFFSGGSPDTLAPEQLRGEPAAPASDVYAFGAIVFQLLSGRPVFSGTPMEIAFAHLSEMPPDLGRVGARGRVTPEFEHFVSALLAKNASERPKSARHVLELLETLDRRASGSRVSEVDETTLTRSIEALFEEPESEGLARDLERLVELGADPGRVADAFNMSAEVLDDAEETRSTRTSLLLRAARLYETRQDTLPAAEKAYLSALELMPGEELMLAGLEEVRKRAGKHEELIEMLLQRNERTEDARERAETFVEIGRIYFRELSDREQALVALTHAFVEQPLESAYAVELYEVARNDEHAWQDVLAVLAESVSADSLTPVTRIAIQLKMAEWYQTHLARFDLAVACLEAVLATDPTHDAALESLAAIHRRSQHWRELGSVLTRRAEAAPAPLARDLNTEAAEILEHQLQDLGGARDLYAQVFAKDPSHRRAADGLCRVHERSEDYQGLAAVLGRRTRALRGEERLKQLCRLAEVLESRLGDSQAALATYESVLSTNPGHREALQGIDQILVRTGQHRELLSILERELALAETPRQKMLLEERLAALYEDEFLDHERAASIRATLYERDRSNLETIAALMRNYRALGRLEAVSSLYEKLLEQGGEPARRVELALEWGRLLRDEMQAPERAAQAYELALGIDPKHELALDALAHLRESAGDATRAIDAILSLADEAASPSEKARHLLRAAKLFESQNNLDRAIEVYEIAADVEPENAALRASLRDAYVKRGDVVLALELFERELTRTEGARQKARLASQIARLARDRLEDNDRAEAAARQALGFDPSDLEATLVLADIAFENQRFVEASRHYESVAGRIDTLPGAEAKGVFLRYVEALARTDKWPKTAGPRERLLELAESDLYAVERLAHLTLEFGDAQAALDQYHTLFTRFEGELPEPLRALAEHRYGEALRRSGELESALSHFERASELDPKFDAALAAQASIQAERGNWEAVVVLKQRQLEIAEPSARFQLLVELGDIAHERLHDRTQASESYIAALEARPDERRVLNKLMQLYSQDEAWDKLVDVVLKLANFVQDSAQKAKYLETAAVVTAHQVGNAKRALEYYERAFALHPSLKALDEAIDIYRAENAHGELERLLRQRLDVATQEDKQDQMLVTFSALAELYEHELGDVDNAIDAYEAAQTLDPGNEKRADVLTELYATDQRFASRGVKLHATLLEANPRRVASYRALRRIYAQIGDVDASWCLCQTLSVLGLADPDEQRYYERLRLERPAAIQSALSDEDWLGFVLHPLVDPLLTSVFALIEPAVIESRAEPLEEFGYTEAHRITLDAHSAALSQSLHHAAGALGVPLPPTYENTNDPGGLSFLHTFEPAVVLGNAALNAEVPSQAAAFIAARHLTYLRPGLYLRQLVGTGTGLKSWLFAAIQLTAPQFPVVAELEGPISEALATLKHSLPATARDHLSRVVTRMLQSGAALDLRRWIAGVDLTADRGGLILCNDLDTAGAILEVSDDSASAVPSQERYRQLVIYSASPEYLELRKKLGLALDG